jgi:hypothetical protein
MIVQGNNSAGAGAYCLLRCQRLSARCRASARKRKPSQAQSLSQVVTCNMSHLTRASHKSGQTTT